jgi:hypothetical protein
MLRDERNVVDTITTIGDIMRGSDNTSVLGCKDLMKMAGTQGSPAQKYRGGCMCEMLNGEPFVQIYVSIRAARKA